MSTIVTGAAGFIGFHTALRLLQRGESVYGIDNLNSYYDVGLKVSRLDTLKEYSNFEFQRVNLADESEVQKVFQTASPEFVVHLGAQAGVRYSLENPHAYIESNVTGTLNVLECSRKQALKHLVYASSSSIYGANRKTPFAVEDRADHPVSLYGATKKSNELMAHAYSSLYDLPTTGLRFFTVYGPWGRPDMAPIIFTKKILADEPISVFNYGKHKRDFTFIDDIVTGILKVLEAPALPDPDWDPTNPVPGSSSAPYRIYNIGNTCSVELMDFIKAIETCLGKKAKLDLQPMQAGDVLETLASVDALKNNFGYRPNTSLEVGVGKFIDWYQSYYTP